jgi:DNA-binding CsgD family transcriptional regulator
MAFNREAAAILGFRSKSENDRCQALQVPDDIADHLDWDDLKYGRAFTIDFQVGRRRYCCHASPMILCSLSLPSPLVSLTLQRNCSTDEVLSAAALRFNLTAREREALKGISSGLTSKEVAERMKISPNTVKVYARTVMMKLGVTTRAAVLAKILGTDPSTTEEFIESD